MKKRKVVRKKSKKASDNKSAIFGLVFVLVLIFIFGNFGNELRKFMEEEKIKQIEIITEIKAPEKEAIIFEGQKEEEKIQPEIIIADEWQSHYVNFNYLNIRSEPSITSEVIETLSEDDEVLGAPIDNPEWLKVILPDGTYGYAAKRYLSLLTHDIAAEKGLFQLPILMYHYVSVPPSGSDKMREGLSVSPAVLGEHLEYLKKVGYTSVTFKDLQLAKNGTLSLPDKPAVLTFDDGHIDHYKNAFPLLQKFNMRGVFFVISDKVGTEGYMTWEQIQEMSDAGMEIGSHAKGDLDLRFVSEKEGFNQIGDSKRIIEEKLGRPVYSFAYPSGHHAAWLYKVLSKSGYSFARTTEFGKYVNIHLHPYTLPTLRINQGTEQRDLQRWGIR